MADIETIKAALRICLAGNPCAGCHYFKECYKENHTDILLEDTLKAIEALQAENRLITENNTEIDKQRGEIAVRFEKLRLENERLKAKPPKSAWIHRVDMDYKDKNGVVHFHGMCESCGFIHDFNDVHTGQYKFCPECGSKNEQWKDGE